MFNPGNNSSLTNSFKLGDIFNVFGPEDFKFFEFGFIDEKNFLKMFIYKLYQLVKYTNNVNLYF